MKKHFWNMAAVSGFLVFVVLSFYLKFDPGKQMGQSLFYFSVEMFKILPCAFILIGLFEVWVKRETIERHMGHGSGIKGYALGILLGGTTVGGLYVAFPVAQALHHKGARLGVIFTYVGASAICRVPMTIFEASFMGLKFSLIRLLVSIPLVILTSAALGRFLEKRHYTLLEGK